MTVRLAVNGFGRIGRNLVRSLIDRQNSGDLEDIMSWMRNGKKEEDDPTGDFRKIESTMNQGSLRKRKPRSAYC